MSVPTKPYVTIKGIKDGLVFHMDDACSFHELLDELQIKLEQHKKSHWHHQPVDVKVKLGHRYLTSDQEQQMSQLIRAKSNLRIASFDCDVVLKEELEKARLKANVNIINKTIRSGQVIRNDGHILILGDVNPGSAIESAGSIFVLGALRGMAHAGIEGDDQAIIAASVLQPTQLRIANVVNRPPDEWDRESILMEFAYIEGEHIVIEKLSYLAQVRPGLMGYI
jgi:septum site-determining protein MinC